MPLPEFPCSINHLLWNVVCRLTFDGSAILQSATMIVSQGGQAELWFGREGQDSLDDAAHRGELFSMRELDRTAVEDAVAHHCDELLFIVVNATIVANKALHDHDEDL